MLLADLVDQLVSGLFIASSLALAIMSVARRRPTQVASTRLLGTASAANSITFWAAGLVLLVPVTVGDGQRMQRSTDRE